MSNPEQLERELREYLEKEPNLGRNERFIYLKAIVDKHLEFGKLEHVVNSNDFINIINDSKVKYGGLKLPMKISRIRVDSSDLPHVAMIEAFVSYLNRMHLLKKLVKFEITE